MSESVNLIPDSNSPMTTETSKPSILNNLPDFPISDQRSGIKIQQQIDLMLLTIEALQLGGSEYMLAIAQELELQYIIKNRLVLWRLRCSNPWRKCYSREIISLEQAKALVIIMSHHAKKLMVIIRQLILAEQQMRDKNMPIENNFRLSEYLERFATHFRSRMNARRAKVRLFIFSR